MNQLHIHYQETDGEIWGWETGTPTPRQGLATVTIDTDIVPNPKLHKIDIATQALVDKTSEERELANAPTLQQVQGRVTAALSASDQYMMPDRPLADAVRNAWVVYRQTLRDLSKLPTPAAQLAAWPSLPS